MDGLVVREKHPPALDPLHAKRAPLMEVDRPGMRLARERRAVELAHHVTIRIDELRATMSARIQEITTARDKKLLELLDGKDAQEIRDGSTNELIIGKGKKFNEKILQKINFSDVNVPDGLTTDEKSNKTAEKVLHSANEMIFRLEDELDKEIDKIILGGNYGWNYREGTLAGPRANPPPTASFIAPIWDYSHSVGQSVTGGIVARGPRDPTLYGHYLFADFSSGRIWSLRPDDTRPVTSDRVKLLATSFGISSFGVDPATGEVLLANLNEGSVRRLVASPNQGGVTFPATLSATGAFTSVATLSPAPGLVAYEPNVSFWSDHAKKRRWFALRDTTSRFGFSPDGNWSLPTGAVWVKHFDLELRRGDPSTARRIETRFLVKTDTGSYGLSYRWNEAQTDASLVGEEGADQTFTITENGLARTQTWRFPSRAECLACHTPVGGHALSFNTRQLPAGPPHPARPRHSSPPWPKPGTSTPRYCPIPPRCHGSQPPTR